MWRLAEHRLAQAIGRRLAGERGEGFVDLAEATVRSVARGVIGVALIQSLLAGLGLVIAGVPAAGLWTLLCLVLAIVQIGVLPIMLPAAISEIVDLVFEKEPARVFQR